MRAPPEAQFVLLLVGLDRTTLRALFFIRKPTRALKSDFDFLLRSKMTSSVSARATTRRMNHRQVRARFAQPIRLADFRVARAGARHVGRAHAAANVA